MIAGKQSIKFDNNVYIKAGATVAGTKEKKGPLGCCFDVVSQDDLFGGESWEEAESRIQSLAFEKLLEKTGMMSEDIRYIYAGDLLGQLIATSFGLKTYDVPLFGLYGACSTMGESLSLAAMCVNAGFADNVAAIASSHFASAEKQFRFPLLYGNQRPMSSTWTVTGAGMTKSVKQKVTIDSFEYGAVFDGKLSTKVVPGGTVLVDTTFKIHG